jgi:hypothetical protein
MNKKIKDGDYILKDGSAWLEVKDFAIRIHATDEGVAIDVYKNKEEEEAITSCYAFDSELL